MALAAWMAVLPARAQAPDTALAPAQAAGAVAASGASSAATALPQTATTVATEVLAQGLEHPWSLAFLPGDAGVLITERPGRLRHWSPQTGLSAPIQGVPAVFAQGQGGLLDVAVHPDFPNNRLVYLSYALGEDRGPAHAPAGTVLALAKLSADKRRLEGLRVVFQQLPKRSSGVHFGSRLAFDGQGHLYITLGDNNQRAAAQDLAALQGKIVRLRDDGGVPADNPFAGQAGKRAEIWSYGHRNVQGAAINPWTGQLWTHEHGPRGGDEINVIRAGANYGWPLATYGINYSGLPIPEAQGEQLEDAEAPHHYWPVSPAISGMAFYDHGRFPQWRRSLFIGALKDKALIRLQLAGDGQTIAGPEERLLQALDARIRDVRVGPDGYVYVLTDARDGQLIRVAPGP